MMSVDRHILVVEDDDGVREVIQEILLDYGYHVSCAANGQEMRAIAITTNVNLVLLDVGLPDMPCDSLVADAQSRNIPVLLMSAHPERVAHLVDKGISCLHKPFRIAVLVGAIEAALAAGPPTTCSSNCCSGGK